MATITENVIANLARHAGTYSVAGHREKAIADFGSDAAYAAFNTAGHSGLPTAAYIERHRAEVKTLVAAGVLHLDEHHGAGGAYYAFTK